MTYYHGLVKLKNPMIKLTKRKGFNFFRSYFDVYNELNDEDKVAFIDALLNKQFLGIDPENLTGMANFAWISQVHSITQQVKGFEDKTGIKLNPTVGGMQGGTDDPRQQVQEKGKVKGKVKDINSRKQDFYKSLIPFLEKYDKELIKEFYEYWTEHGEKDRKFRKEKEKSFSTELRLKTWFKRSKDFKKEKSFAKKEKESAWDIIQQVKQGTYEQ